ncbi:hypothetical protein NU08_1951 [Flavobacterium anhuiense]|uniref:Uncharacterized protein n=2 Tax=Flavobacterium anhuiense TaxID=459526 RepID=A0A444VZW7_9FLAO|nr:hypothetical protein NU08_1951 [Flavobacterium anhuiense]
MNMNFFDKFFDFVFDERKKISSKAAIIILVLFGVLLINNVLGVSSNYVVNNKIEQIQKLNLIISNPASDSVTIKAAKKIREEIFSRKSVLEYSYDYFAQLSFRKDIKKDNISKSVKPVEEIDAPSDFWFYFTASGVYILLGIAMIFLMLFIDKVSTISQRVAVTLILVTTFFGLGQIFYWLCSLIPMILSNSWILNYLVNLIIQIGTIFIFIWMNIKLQKLN